MEVDQLTENVWVTAGNRLILALLPNEALPVGVGHGRVAAFGPPVGEMQKALRILERRNGSRPRMNVNRKRSTGMAQADLTINEARVLVSLQTLRLGVEPEDVSVASCPSGSEIIEGCVRLFDLKGRSPKRIDETSYMALHRMLALGLVMIPEMEVAPRRNRRYYMSAFGMRALETYPRNTVPLLREPLS